MVSKASSKKVLVLGRLLVQRIPTYKTYTNMPGYDLVATNPDTNKSARIQVKSRWRTGAPFFVIKNFDCEFVVAVRLNRGKKGGGGRVRAPKYFVLPVEMVKSVHRPGTWCKVVFRDIADLEEYQDNWSLIADFLADRCGSTRLVSHEDDPPDAARRRG
jgi:hypothetical protein